MKVLGQSEVLLVVLDGILVVAQTVVGVTQIVTHFPFALHVLEVRRQAEVLLVVGHGLRELSPRAVEVAQVAQSPRFALDISQFASDVEVILVVLQSAVMGSQGLVGHCQVSVGGGLRGPVVDFHGDLQLLAVVANRLIEGSEGVVGVTHVPVGPALSSVVIQLLNNGQVNVIPPELRPGNQQVRVCCARAAAIPLGIVGRYYMAMSIRLYLMAILEEALPSAALSFKPSAIDSCCSWYCLALSKSCMQRAARGGSRPGDSGEMSGRRATGTRALTSLSLGTKDGEESGERRRACLRAEELINPIFCISPVVDRTINRLQPHHDKREEKKILHSPERQNCYSTTQQPGKKKKTSAAVSLRHSGPVTPLGPLHNGQRCASSPPGEKSFVKDDYRPAWDEASGSAIEPRGRTPAGTDGDGQKTTEVHGLRASVDLYAGAERHKGEDEAFSR
ncbi:hypothetical protein EYF80_007418 [Liparis tanakae]|uniref:Uncharacterized protein n=1 Tax=Liparis tanakae TaxID=230148 RepID=A0A4Z2IX14_9TELE|nr:hypothetical protein EYF80_007418 [Liparis tanakae]